MRIMMMMMRMLDGRNESCQVEVKAANLGQPYCETGNRGKPHGHTGNCAKPVSKEAKGTRLYIYIYIYTKLLINPPSGKSASDWTNDWRCTSLFRATPSNQQCRQNTFIMEATHPRPLAIERNDLGTSTWTKMHSTLNFMPEATASDATLESLDGRVVSVRTFTLQLYRMR